MPEFFSFLKMLVLCVAGFFALLVILVVLINYLPRSPLRDVLGAVTKRIGATAAVAMIAIPVQPIVGIDGIYDIISSILLLCYWFLLISDIRKAFVSSREVKLSPVQKNELLQKNGPDLLV